MNPNLEKLRNEYEILYVWNYLEWGGMQTYYFASLRLLVREGLNVKVLMPHGSSEKLSGYLEDIGVKYEFFQGATDVSDAKSVFDKLKRRWRKFDSEMRLITYLEKRGLEKKIIQIDAGPWQDFQLLKKLAEKTDVFITPHIALPFDANSRRCRNWKRNFEKLAEMPNFHLNVANRDVLENFKNYLSPEKHRKIKLAYSGINTEEIQQALDAEIDREKLGEKFGLPKGRKLVFTLGQIIERKGWQVLIRAVEILSKQEPDLFFVWIGDGEQYADFERLIIEDDLSNFVKIISPKEIGDSRFDLLTFLRLAEIFVLPSLKEGLPQALLEALGLGLPCIASSVNGIPEIIRHEKTGLLIEAGNSDDLAEKLKRLANDENLRKTLSKTGQNLAFTEFDEKNGARVLLEEYLKAVEND